MRFRIVASWLSLSLMLLPPTAESAGTQASSSRDPSGLAEVIGALPWRSIGPASFGGRIADVEAVPSDPATIFVGAASGGVFRSRNNGVTWDPVFDQTNRMLSIGDLAIAPSDPSIVWAGTGEPNNRQSSPWGAGIYRSLDGGDTWDFMGLENTQHIGRVLIHPHNPDIVFVAALGHLWGPNPERGLYRTIDGGDHWEKVLDINPDTGVVDVAMEPNGRVLYAAAYQRRRRAWGFVGGGPHSAIYRSLDGGEHWEKLSQGLPSGDTGRIGLAVAASQPERVYAIIENKAGGIFRSDDRGASWEKVNSLNPRPMYYSQIRVDPGNPDKVWVLGSPLFVSIDGGKTFTSEGTAEKIHVDHHALWINPQDGDHLILGNDGGLYITYDGSRNWDFIDNLPIAQYYAIGLDRREPYWVYGGTQDNGTWALPSRTYSQLGITNADVVNVAYGDGFYTAVHPEDHTLIFAESQNGRLYFVDMDTLEERGVRPAPEPSEDEDAEAEEYRFNWSSPILLSPHDPNVVYYGGNKLFRSADRGQTWTEISPDLTNNAKWKELPVMGVIRNEDTLSRDDGIAHFGTLTTLSESPIKPGLLLTGSDDGRVHLTRNGGKDWVDLTPRFDLDQPHWVSRVVASQHSVDRLYATFDGHQDDDFSPYLFRSDDGGQSWANLGASLPEGTVVNVVTEHPRNRNILFAGTEWGLFLSLDGGARWVRAAGQLPRLPIDDIIFEPRQNDLVLGTHGRGIWIWDDVRLLESLASAEQSGEALLAAPRPAVEFYEQRALPAPGASEFAGPNPPYGALLTYYLPDDAKSSESEAEAGEVGKEPAAAGVHLTIQDSAGETVRTLDVPATAGLHRAAWDLRYPLSFKPGPQDEGWFGPLRGPFVLPGQYKVVLEVGGQSLEQPLEVRIDPAAETTLEQLQERLDLSRKTEALLGFFVKAGERVEQVADKLKGLHKDLDQDPGRAQLLEAVAEAEKALEPVRKSFAGGWRSDKFKLLDLLGQLQASSAQPTQAQVRSYSHLTRLVRKKVDAFNQLRTEHLAGLQQQLAQAGLPDLVGEPLQLP